MAVFWMGNEDSYDIVAQANDKVADGQKQGRFLSEPSEKDLPPLYELVGNTGVIRIEGSLINGSAGWGRLFGVTGYDDILKAAMQGAADPEASTLLFEVSSGGGHVHGLAEAAAQLTKISASKPSMTYTPDVMASAAYWLGSAVNGPIVAAPTSEVGSLGIMKVSKNLTKMLEKDGVVVTIHRSGEMKARDNPFEELTPEAKAHLQSQLADLHGMFRTHVGARRPVMTPEDLAAATDGRTFLGQRAKQAKLVDSIGSFDVALKLLDKHSRKQDTSSNFKGASMFMTPKQQAAYLASLAGGATVEAALLAAGVVATAEQVTEMTASHAASQAEYQAAEAARATKAASDAAAEAARVAAAAAAAGNSADGNIAQYTAQIDLLKSQLTTVQAQVQALTTDLATERATNTSKNAAHDGLLAIARKATAKMLIPLGGSAASADAMDASTVIAEHARVETLFTAKFPIGQQSKPTEGDDKNTASANMDFLLRLPQSSK